MRHYGCFLCLIVLPLLSNAQYTTFNNWFAFGLDYNITKSLEAKVKLGYRMIDFGSESTFVDCILRYKVHKYLRVGVGWRYAGKGNPTDVDAITNRFHVEASSKIKISKGLFLKPRLRYQFRFKDWFVSKLGYIPRQSIRARMLLNYNINKRWAVVLGGEFFTAFSYNSLPEVEPFRVISGISYTIKKTHEFGLNYNIEQDIAEVYTAHILVASYKVNLNKIFKRKKKKKKD